MENNKNKKTLNKKYQKLFNKYLKKFNKKQDTETEHTIDTEIINIGISIMRMLPNYSVRIP